MFTNPSHIRRYLALLPVEILAGMPVFLYLFAAFVPPHRCRVQQCDDGDDPRPPLVNETWTDIAIPKVEAVEGLFSSRGATEECAMFRVLDDRGDCSPDNFDRNVTVECQEYVYDSSVFEETLATKLNLVCGREGLQKLLGTFVMFGLLVGSFVGGWAGDYFGKM